MQASESIEEGEVEDVARSDADDDQLVPAELGAKVLIETEFRVVRRKVPLDRSVDLEAPKLRRSDECEQKGDPEHRAMAAEADARATREAAIDSCSTAHFRYRRGISGSL